MATKLAALIDREQSSPGFVRGITRLLAVLEAARQHRCVTDQCDCPLCAAVRDCNADPMLREEGDA